MDADKNRPPYWEFTYLVNGMSGIRFTDIVVRDSQTAGSIEEVFESIDFADFAIGFSDGSAEGFDIARAMGNPGSFITVAENGSIGTDHLFQRGLRITLVDNVLAHREGRCLVTMELSVVFRGAKNDFDPGGIPVAMILWPEIAFTWDRNGATKSVNRFRGSVKMTVHNRMFPGHSGSGTHHTTGTPPLANVASVFADANTPGLERAGAGLRALGGKVQGAPFGWSQLFDYVGLNLQFEREFVGVYGPIDGNFYRASSTTVRERTYSYPATLVDPHSTMKVRKADRQGVYDNIHAHAKMPNSDRCNNIQIHAPFCGHSCVHMHWRWSNVSSNGSVSGPGWRYKGWSNPIGATPVAHSTDDAPLIPPNQRLMVALCQPGATRFNDDHIINPAAPAALDPLRKLIYYSVTIHDPVVAGQKQVILSHGIGWAYRYATPKESKPMETLPLAVLAPLFPWSKSPTQAEIADIFERYIYPTFRYVGLTAAGFQCTQQVPDGSWNKVLQPLWGTVSVVSMEDL